MRSIRTPSPPRAAVIGAGLAGAACAARLAAVGWQITVFDKARGAGGRAGTRRRGRVAADHGALFFTVRTDEFRAVVDRWLGERVAMPWDAQVVSLGADGRAVPAGEELRYVGVPGMSALARSLLRRVTFVPRTRIAAVRRDVHWTLTDSGRGAHGPFDAVMLAVPPAQAVEIAGGQTALTECVAQVAMAPCWAAVVAFASRLDVPWDAAHLSGSPVAWIARNASKPGRPALPDVWTLHATADWSVTHLDLPAHTVARRLLGEFAHIAPTSGADAIKVFGHRWRFARPVAQREPRPLFDPQRLIGFCGDWTGHARVESAVLSGIGLAADAIAALGPAREAAV